jgi:hypothetical protein
MTKRRDWTVSHSRAGNRLILQELDWRARLWDLADTTLTGICDLGLWGHGLAEHLGFLWHVPTGRPNYEQHELDDDGRFLTNSLAAAIIKTEEAISLRAMGAAKTVVSVPIDDDTMLTLWPEAEWLIHPDSARWQPEETA